MKEIEVKILNINRKEIEQKLVSIGAKKYSRKNWMHYYLNPKII